jgi:TolB-like protein
VHLGDTIFEKGDIRGDGVNIASRLEGMAVAGGVFVSKEVHDQLANQKEFEGVSLGLQSMKGVGRLIEVYGLKGDKLSEPNPENYDVNYCECHSDDEVPSVVILPFNNKGKKEDDYYSYGIWLDLITEVSGAGLIRVASKHQIDDMGDISIKEIPNRLCVRYIVNGELWKLGNKFQLFIELYDTKESKVLWTDKWQENWENITTIKSHLSDGLLKALSTKPKVKGRVETTNSDAYEYYLRAKYIFEMRSNDKDIHIAREFINKALEIDDNMILAKSLLGKSYIFTNDNDKAMNIFEQNLSQAKELKDNSGIALSYSNIGFIFWYRKKYDKALDYYNRSLAIVETLNDKSQIARLFHLIGHTYIDKNEFNNICVTNQMEKTSNLGFII